MANIEEKMSQQTAQAMKTYLDVLKEGEHSAKKVANNLAKIVFDSIAACYAKDAKRRTEVMEEFIACASGPPRGT